MRLLLVDDDADFTSLITSNAPSWLRITECPSSEDVVRLVKQLGTGRFDLALIDLNMRAYLERLSELEGLALVRWLRRQGETKPVIVISGHLQKLPHAGAESAVLGFLRKPIDLDSVFRFIGAYADLFGLREHSSKRERS